MELERLCAKGSVGSGGSRVWGPSDFRGGGGVEVDRIRVYLGVSENRGPQNSTLNNRIRVVRTPNKVPPIFGNSHLGLRDWGLDKFRVGVTFPSDVISPGLQPGQPAPNEVPSLGARSCKPFSGPLKSEEGFPLQKVSGGGGGG